MTMTRTLQITCPRCGDPVRFHVAARLLDGTVYLEPRLDDLRAHRCRPFAIVREIIRRLLGAA